MEIRKGIHHVAMRAIDFDATVKFYTEGLGFKKGLQWGEGEKRAIFLDAGNGNYIELFAGGKELKEKGHFYHLALLSTDCEKDVERARRAGAEITKEPTDLEIHGDPVTKIRIAFCKGPNGETIEFFQYR